MAVRESRKPWMSVCSMAVELALALGVPGSETPPADETVSIETRTGVVSPLEVSRAAPPLRATSSEPVIDLRLWPRLPVSP